MHQHVACMPSGKNLEDDKEILSKLSTTIVVLPNTLQLQPDITHCHTAPTQHGN